MRIDLVKLRPRLKALADVWKSPDLAEKILAQPPEETKIMPIILMPWQNLRDLEGSDFSSEWNKIKSKSVNVSNGSFPLFHKLFVFLET